MAVLNATEAGSLPVSDLIIFTLIFLDQSSSCSIAAALNVSAAPRTNDFWLSLKNLPSLPIVVVLPTPFTPETTMTVGLLDSKESNFLWKGNKNSVIFEAKILIISLGLFTLLSILIFLNSFFS